MNPVRIGPYLIDRRIGAGGMGNVYLARHEETGEVVAVKELPASLAREEGFVHRFNREIEAMRKLNSPNIVKLIDSGEDDEVYYYAMEYVDGETLTTRLRRDRKIPWLESVEFARQICLGLKAAHDAGVIHRDLKPSNLMVSKDGVVKIADFGVAQVFAADRLTLTGGVIGTAEFMSPEQVTGSRADKRSDLYSLGCVLYTMIVGHPPFMGQTASDIMQKQRFGRFDPARNYVPEIPIKLDELIAQLLEKDPDKRPPDAFVTARRLQEVCRKIELQDSEYPATPDDVTRVAPDSVRKPVGATLIRDLFRLDAAASDEGATVVGRTLNNAYVLMSLLALLIVIIIWSMTSNKQMGDLSEDVDSSKTEAERVIQRARWRWKGGDPITALEQLDALEAIVLTDASQQPILKQIAHLRKGIRNQIYAPDQRGFVEKSLRRAESLADEQKDQARSIYQGIVKLYGSDPTLAFFVETARDKLKELEEQTHEKP